MALVSTLAASTWVLKKRVNKRDRMAKWSKAPSTLPAHQHKFPGSIPAQVLALSRPTFCAFASLHLINSFKKFTEIFFI